MWLSLMHDTVASHVTDNCSLGATRGRADGNLPQDGLIGHLIRRIHRVSKNCAKLFCQKFVKFPPNLIIFGRKMIKRLKLSEVHSVFTSPNSRHHTTVLNTEVQNCYTTLKVVICSKLSNDLNSTSKVKCGLFSRITSSYNSSVQNCQNLCLKWAPRTRTQALRWRHQRKHEAAFAASQEYVTVQGLGG